MVLEVWGGGGASESIARAVCFEGPADGLAYVPQLLQ